MKVSISLLRSFAVSTPLAALYCPHVFGTRSKQTSHPHEAKNFLTHCCLIARALYHGFAATVPAPSSSAACAQSSTGAHRHFYRYCAFHSFVFAGSFSLSFSCRQFANVARVAWSIFLCKRIRNGLVKWSSTSWTKRMLRPRRIKVLNRLQRTKLLRKPAAQRNF
jgi:hypothetical protein